MAQPRYILLVDIDAGDPDGDALALSVVLPEAILSAAYNGALIGSGGVLPYVYAISAGSLPPGLSLNTTTGAITGTPTTTGRFEFTAAVTDAALDVASKTLSLDVTAGIAIAGRFAQGEVGIAYSSGLSALGGTPPFTWSVLSGALPGGLSINSSTGIVSGAPTTAATFNVTIRATDAAGGTEDFPTSISIAPAVTLTGTLPAGVTGLAYSAALITAGGVGPFTYSLASGALPAGLTLSSPSGIVSGTPAVAGAYSFSFNVLDSLGGTATQAVSLAIADAGSGGGGGGVTSVNGQVGDVVLYSSDASVSIVEDSSGAIDFTTAGGGGGGSAPYITGIAVDANVGDSWSFAPTLNNDGGATAVLWAMPFGTKPPGSGVFVTSTGAINTGTLTTAGVYPFMLVATPRDGSVAGAGAVSYQRVVVTAVATKWDPVRHDTNVSVSNSDRTATALANFSPARVVSNVACSTDFYVEVAIDVQPASAGIYVGIGPSNASTRYNDTAGAYSGEYAVNSGGQFSGGSSPGSFYSFVAGDVVKLCRKGGNLWFGTVAAGWYGGGDPDTNASPMYTGTTGTVFLLASLFSYSGPPRAAVTINSDASTYAGTPPAGVPDFG